MASIVLRFVDGSDVLSDGIKFAEDYQFSHVEAVTPWGTYLGAHADGGVLDRAIGYDVGHFSAEKFVTLPDVPPGSDVAFYDFLKTRIGTPYDFAAIFGFASRFDLHQAHHLICSALQTIALATPAVRYFANPLAVPAHEVSPRDLALMLSARIKF